MTKSKIAHARPLAKTTPEPFALRARAHEAIAAAEPFALRARAHEAIAAAEASERAELTDALDGLARIATRLEGVAFARGHRDVDQAIGDALAALAGASAHVRSAVRAYGGAS